MQTSIPRSGQPFDPFGTRQTRLGQARLLLLCAFLISIPTSLLMPPHLGWENGVIENVQVLVLLGGFAAAAVAVSKANGKSERVLWLGIAPIWLLLAGRELSWGAVFYDPTAVTSEGPQFSSGTLWFKPHLYFAVGSVLVGCAALLAIARIDRVIGRMLRHATFPWAETLVIALVALGSTFAEGHLGIDSSFMGDQAQIMEELLELGGYVALVLAQAWVSLAISRTAVTES